MSIPRIFKKGSDVVTVSCFMEITDTLNSFAYKRCQSWENSNKKEHDLDWLFRPVSRGLTHHKLEGRRNPNTIKGPTDYEKKLWAKKYANR